MDVLRCVVEIPCLQSSRYGGGLYTFQQNGFLKPIYLVEDTLFTGNYAGDGDSGAINLELIGRGKMRLVNVTCTENEVRWD